MSKDKFVSKTGGIISYQEIKLVISNLLNNIIEENIPFTLVESEEPFYNVYKDKISYDYSGEVIEMTKEDLDDLVQSIDKEDLEIYTSPLDKLISNIYINQWTPSYVSNLGKNWISYEYILTMEYNDWKYDNFILYDEENDIEFDDLEIDLDEILYNFIKETSHVLYIYKLYKTLNKL